MPEIIPVIIPKTFQELQEKVKLIEPYVKTAQIDVVDGIFVSNTTWPFDSSRNSGLAQGKPSVKDLDTLETNLELEAHLMIESPHRVLNEWLASRVKRIILHWEAIDKISKDQFSISDLIQETHKHNKEFGVALNLETPVSVLDNFVNDIDRALIMSVKTGWGGQEFDESATAKIIALRQKYPDVKIEVDGGVNQQNILKLARAGVDFLVMGSAIFGSENPAEAIKELNKLLPEYR